MQDFPQQHEAVLIHLHGSLLFFQDSHLLPDHSIIHHFIHLYSMYSLEVQLHQKKKYYLGISWLVVVSPFQTSCL